MQKILVIQTAFIGDVVLATALVEKLHEHYPAASIDFLLRKGNEGLLANHPYLNEVLIWNKQEDKYKNLLQMLQRIRNKHYDVVINVQRFAATGFLTVLSGAKHTVGFDKNPWSFLFSKKVKHVISTADNVLHEVERNQELIRHLTDARPAKPRLYPSAADREKIATLQHEPYICIAPASVWFTKQFPKEKWIELLDVLPAVHKVYLLGAPSDKDLCETIRTGTSNKNVENLAGKLNLLQSTALQEGAEMNYVNDSAPMHFASSVNAPVTAVYCSTVPSFGFGPLSECSSIVQTEEPLACKPCGLHGHKACPLGHFKCAHTIRAQQLLEVLDQKIVAGK
ncbi:glycosyltransferase family 9 protein [Aridibaculum aurantiacum]|uniref:glycosyltransferase family 9 protein n=1 Tax=Aridibaculum aurantiacum TaxID=2810307 RepID=UPI001A9731D8|nr:glycosyltransferase family 9 protein [Aridibaculum aurantiacum]